jgi:hypothetical protein
MVVHLADGIKGDAVVILSPMQRGTSAFVHRWRDGDDTVDTGQLEFGGCGDKLSGPWQHGNVPSAPD